MIRISKASQHLKILISRNIDKLAGATSFKEQIIAGVPKAGTRKSWEPGLGEFKEIRKKYLLYQ